MRRLGWSALLLLLAPVVAPAQTVTNGVVSIGKVDSMWSGVLKENRKYWVYTPGSYNDSTYLPQKYPVLYLLDGDAHFASVVGLLQFLGGGVNGVFLVPEMIVVAIPNTDRSRDMTPTHVEKGPDGKTAPFFKTTGGMGNFLSFIKSELIPKIDQSFRTAPYRIFVGHSLGGITAIDALYTIPETFNSYIAIDPSLWWDNRALLKQAPAYFSKPVTPKRALYLAQANTIQAADTAINVHFGAIAQFNGIAEAHPEAGIRYAFKYYPEDSHGSVPMIAEYDALRFIFAPYKADLFQALERPAFVREHFAKVSDAMGYQVNPPEPMLDIMGHIALSRDTTKAIELFQMSADLYPTSPKAYDGLGDGWKAKGDKNKAREYYEKALALKPSDQYAKDMLKQLGPK